MTRPRWTRPLGPKGSAALTPYAAVLVNREPDRILVLEPRTGRELADLRSSAQVLAVGPEGMVIGDGRDIGYLRFGARAGTPDGSDTGVPDPGTRPGDTGPTCDGPKDAPCPPADGGTDG